MNAVLAAQVDALLPQTQCTRCGYPACRPYADAMAAGEAAINLCEPGGSALIPQLAALLDQAVLPRAHPEPQAMLARIREADCIGCARCLPACPVDAIVGARSRMHGVLASDCTGCQLCLASCPVDCIELYPLPSGVQPPTAADNRQRFLGHQTRWQGKRRVPAPTGAAPGSAAALTDEGGLPSGTMTAPCAEAVAASAAAVTRPAGHSTDASRRARREAMIAAARAAAARRRAQPEGE